MLRFTTLIAFAVTATQPALAAPAKEYGAADGERFEYTTELRADGVIHMAGTMLDLREPFFLDVTPKGRVYGRFGGTPVEFDVGKKVRDEVAADLGEGQALASAGFAN